jgi:hypothetical protein
VTNRKPATAITPVSSIGGAPKSLTGSSKYITLTMRR